MQNLPPYVSYFQEVYAPELVTLIVNIETYFEKMDYTEHMELLQDVFNYPNNDSTRELCERGLNVYRAAIDKVLKLQGITLSNHEEEKFSNLEQVLKAVTILATRPIQDVLEGETFEDIDDDLSFFAEVIALLLNWSVPDVLLVIADVTTELVEYLMAGQTIDDYRKENAEFAQKRFMQYLGDNKTGLVCDLVRSIGYFGYDAKSVAMKIADQIEALNDADACREIALLVLGSNIKETKDLKKAAEILTELIFELPNRVLAVNAKLPNFEKI